jgi:acyl-CoA synthetase (AMP-forming)/AMP-acid ligase II
MIGDNQDIQKSLAASVSDDNPDVWYGAAMALCEGAYDKWCLGSHNREQLAANKLAGMRMDFAFGDMEKAGELTEKPSSVARAFVISLVDTDVARRAPELFKRASQLVATYKMSEAVPALVRVVVTLHAKNQIRKAPHMSSVAAVRALKTLNAVTTQNYGNAGHNIELVISDEAWTIDWDAVVEQLKELPNRDSPPKAKAGAQPPVDGAEGRRQAEDGDDEARKGPELK